MTLEELLARDKARWDAMTPAQKETMLRLQRESWVRGEMGIGNDAQEAADRAEYRAKHRG